VNSNGHHSPHNHRSNPVSSSNTNSSQPSTPTHPNRLIAVQMQEQQPWSNPVLSPLMVKRLNEGNVVTSMPIDDDEDPSASIDALVGMSTKSCSPINEMQMIKNELIYLKCEPFIILTPLMSVCNESLIVS
jgi:hypothetical protein